MMFDIVPQDLEEEALNIISLDLPFYYRYVDDIVLAASIDKATHILNTFNLFYECLQFIIEYEKDRTLSFLDLSLSVRNDRILIDWFHKKTFSGRYCLISNHPRCHKTGTIYNLVERFCYHILFLSRRI